jgi:hypothetical protein
MKKIYKKNPPTEGGPAVRLAFAREEGGWLLVGKKKRNTRIMVHTRVSGVK